MIAAVIVAGGMGSRMQSAVRKQYLLLGGRPILAQTLAAVDRFADLDRMVLVLPAEDIAWCRQNIISTLALTHDVHIVAGGHRRQDSVRNGLRALDTDTGVVMIHDGVRPFVRLAMMDALIGAVNVTGACIPALAVADTLKQVNDDGLIARTLDRRGIYFAQTPQTFHIDLIRSAHHFAENTGFEATDDASVAENAGHRVRIVAGDRENIKITTPGDLAVAHTILASWKWNDE